MLHSTPHDHMIIFTDYINCFEICNGNFARNLMCVAMGNKFVLCLVRVPEETDDDVFEWETLKEIYNCSRSHCISFAPNTSLMLMPKTITFSSGGADFILRIFRTDLDCSNTVQMLKGHKSYINDCSFDNDSEYLASVSDDQCCKIWSSETKFKNVITFCLSSAGMSVKWHPNESDKILVAEKKGIIHMYSVLSQWTIMSLETPESPLTSADWSLKNWYHISALADGKIFKFDLSRASRSPLFMKQAHEDGGRCIKFAPNSEYLMASVGRPNITLKIFGRNSIMPILEASVKLYSGLVWHHHLPYIAVASDRKIYFWKIQTTVM